MIEPKLLDLFSGIGGFSLAFRNVFKKGKIVGYSEIDPYAIKVYEKQFKGEKNFGNIEKIKAKSLPDFDICTFGFPCQDLSIAGNRKGFGGKRSSLFYEAVRIIEEKRPSYFMFENVKGIFSSRKGEDFASIIETIAEIGYDGQWQIINSSLFVPQNRERVFFVGHLREKPRPEIFPIGKISELSERKNRADKRQSQTNDCTTTVRNNNTKADGTYVNHLVQIGNVDSKGHNSIWGRVYDPNGISATINSGAGGVGAKTGLYKVKKGLRRLTPLECERLQSFPDNWTESFSDTQRYKMIGNAITVKVAEEIFRRLKKHIKEEKL